MPTEQTLKYRNLNMRYRTDKDTALTMTICAAIAAIAGAGGVVAAIVGLGGPDLLVLTGAAAIAVGAGLLLHGTGALPRVKRRFQWVGDRSEILALIGGLAAEVLGGAAAIVLGIAAIADVFPYLLLPVAAISIGSACLLVAPAQHRMSWLAREPGTRLERGAYHTSSVAAWLLAFAGMAAIFLGTLPLLQIGNELVLSAAAMIAAGAAVWLAAASLAVRYGAQLDTYADDAVDSYADNMLELLRARLEASRTGAMMYEATAEKLVGKVDPFLIQRLETFAEKEVENSEFLAYQIEGLGGDADETSELGEIESRSTSGAEDIIFSSDVRDPLHLLTALHTADMADMMGWKLLTQIAEQVGHEELKHEIKNKYGDKADQVRFMSRILEELAQQSFVREPVAAPLSA